MFVLTRKKATGTEWMVLNLPADMPGDLLNVALEPSRNPTSVEKTKNEEARI